ncbi:hypothetical protein PRZ48_004064 [Zasmidium cellare]|uniref:Uncharacterized protein n=1 Tax=Zasmidium cellare TaxID=395010 RepID=A0ABR0EXL0_ZASCE|nr:hypothetical protein PRZ48_004064 [Zasmidium cellare]
MGLASGSDGDIGMKASRTSQPADKYFVSPHPPCGSAGIDLPSPSLPPPSAGTSEQALQHDNDTTHQCLSSTSKGAGRANINTRLYADWSASSNSASATGTDSAAPSSSTNRRIPPRRPLRHRKTHNQEEDYQGKHVGQTKEELKQQGSDDRGLLRA